MIVVDHFAANANAIIEDGPELEELRAWVAHRNSLAGRAERVIQVALRDVAPMLFAALLWAAGVVGLAFAVR